MGNRPLVTMCCHLLCLRFCAEQFAFAIEDDEKNRTQQPTARVGKGYKETASAEDRGHVQIELAEKNKTEQHNDRWRS